jgi:hypothetical protein
MNASDVRIEIKVLPVAEKRQKKIIRGVVVESMNTIIFAFSDGLPGNQYQTERRKGYPGAFSILASIWHLLSSEK